MPLVTSETTANSNSSWNSWLLKMGQIGCSERSVNSYQYTLCNIPKEWRPIFQSSLPVQITRSNVYNVIHAQIYPSEFCHLVVLLNAFFRLNSYLTENAEPCKRSVTHLHQWPSAVRCLTPSPWSDPFPFNRFWLCLARQTPWSSSNSCQNFMLVFIFPGEMRVPPQRSTQTLSSVYRFTLIT